MTENEQQGGCSTHGPFSVCGHTEKDCPDNGIVEVEDSAEEKLDDLEDQPDFIDFIPLGESMSAAEALEWLYKYYPATKEGVFEKEFSDLANTAGSVQFDKPKLQRHGGSVVLRGTKSDGSPWYSLLSSRSGIKQAKIG